MAISSSSSYHWQPSEAYRQWNVCEDCLIPLGKVFQGRVKRWHHPPRDEEDDERPDYEDIRQQRFHDSFLRPLDSDLRQHDFNRAVLWLKIHAPAVAAEVEQRIDELRAALTPVEGSLNPDALIVHLADASYFLLRVAEELRPLADAEVKLTAGGYVTLQQAAAIVSRSKRTLEKYKAKMPLPSISDGGGKPDEWLWSELRPWLEEYSGRNLPNRFPADEFRKE